MKFIPLTKGYVAIVDDDDYERLSAFRWHAHSKKTDGTIYAYRTAQAGEKLAAVSMHREIVGAVAGEEVDHKNHCGIDNRKENLRRCTPSQNQANKGPCASFPGKTSLHKGVGYNPLRRGAKWRARIKVRGKSKHVGWFATESQAAIAYNAAAQEAFGEFAQLNTVAGLLA